MPIYDYARENVINVNTDDTGNITEHSLCDYFSPIETCRVEVPDIHVTSENYITPVHDPVIPIAKCDNADTDVPGTDRNDVSTTDEHAPSVIDITVNGTGHNYITAII
ncbi:hypothetical protein ACJMK2_026349 [Sinanodonta woodiana]|uniref:Uncharacterized protein n=1 Tax=Sinanodonta woodiana TaxID=1069815 RepID=A0ABD3XKV8_SINWO